MGKLYIEMTDAEYDLFRGIKDMNEKVIFSYLYNWLDMRCRITKAINDCPNPFQNMRRVAVANGSDIIEIVDKNANTTKTLKIELSVISEE